ncbi:KilA-N domain-containing protein [Myxococcus sp. Y35]|uniref:KilA-N domain-containing protein n=1 Tax=Pseudomyxococcus flavus TaxID=3115648 RepID=UPI003CF166CC
MTPCKPSSLTINDVVVNQDSNGRYCLNDLHRAAGLEKRHQPSNFLAIGPTQELIATLESEDRSCPGRNGPVESIRGGPAQGTYVCRELVYAYAAWVSPAFHLRVLRTFDAVLTGQPSASPADPPRTLPSPTEEKVAGHGAVLTALKAVPGLRSGIAASMMLDAIHADTGLTVEPYRKALPPGEGPASSLNATAVGKALGVSSKAANLRLKDAGLQTKNERDEWELTPAGAKYGEAIPYTRGSHSGYQVLWKPEAVDYLRSLEKKA